MATSTKVHEKLTESKPTKNKSKTEPRTPQRYGQQTGKKPCRACTDFKSFAGSQGLFMPAGVGAAAASANKQSVYSKCFGVKCLLEKFDSCNGKMGRMIYYFDLFRSNWTF